MRGNMPCWTKIYAIFWDRGRASFLEKKSTAQKHIQIFSMLRSGFFFRKRRSVMVPRFGFFPGSTDKGLLKTNVHSLMHHPLYSLQGHILWRKNSTFYALLVSYSDVSDHTACENEHKRQFQLQFTFKRSKDYLWIIHGSSIIDRQVNCWFEIITNCSLSSSIIKN